MKSLPYKSQSFPSIASHFYQGKIWPAYQFISWLPQSCPGPKDLLFPPPARACCSNPGSPAEQRVVGQEGTVRWGGSSDPSQK